MVFTAFLFSSCDGMNENVDKYLKTGEIVYIAKSDSAFLYAGKDRFVLRFWISDPRATKMTVKSKFLDADVVIDIPADHNREDFIEKSIPCSAGAINVKLITSDAIGNTSIPDEYMVNVYGNEYLSTLLPKFIKSAIYSSKDSKVTITWGSVASATEYGVKLFYTDKNGNKIEKNYSTVETKTPTIIGDIDISIPLYYQTIFLPEAKCVDLMYTDSTKISISGI
jgi:hypothetical protein